MHQPERPPIDVSQLLERFHDDAALVAELLAANDDFRSACEDLALAKATLAELESIQLGREPKKIAEYRMIVTDLESEIAEAVRHARQAR